MSNCLWEWRYSCLKFEVGAYRTDGRASLKQMTGTQDGAPVHYSHLVTHHLILHSPRTKDRPRWSRSLATKVPRPYSFRFLSVGMDEKRSLQRKRDELVTRIMNSAALLNQERQDNLRRVTLTVVKRVENCIEVGGGIFEHLLWTVAIYWDHLHNQ